MKYYFSIATTLALISPFAACGAGAAEGPGETGNIEEVVSIVSRSERPLADYGGNIAVVGRDDIDLVRATHFSELAVRVAGVNVARNDGQEYLAAIRSPVFTGAGACGAFLMAQDGVPLRSAGFCNVNELFEAFTEQAQRIEIVKGPGPALYGSNALHGMINIVTRAADSPDGELSAEGGAYGFFRLDGTKGVVGEQHGLRASASLVHDGGYRDQAGYDQQKVALRHDYTGSDWTANSSLTLTRLDQETAGYITGPEAYKDRDIARTNPNPEAYRKAKSLRLQSRLSRQVAADIRWQVTPYLRVLDMEFLMHFLPGQPVEDNRQTGFGLQNGLYIHEGRKLELIIGADVEYTRAALQQTQEAPTAGSPFLRATIPAGKQYDYDVNSLMTAAFLQVTWKVSPRVRLVAGGRLEYMRYDYRNNMLPGRTDAAGRPCGFGGCRYSRPASRIDDFTNFSPKVELLYDFAGDHNIYVTASHGFRAPQATELYRLQRAQTVAELNSVSLRNIETGLRGRVGAFSYTLALYAMEKDNVIFRDAAFFNVDNGRSDHIGADLSAEVAVSDRLRLRGNVSFARHRYDFDYQSDGVNLKGRDIDGAPRRFGGLQVNWRPTDRIVAELEWVHMGPYYLDPENRHRYDGHDYLNFRAHFQMSERYGFSLRVMNLTDARYAERADYTSFTAERYFPGKPRSLYGGIHLSF